MLTERNAASEKEIGQQCDVNCVRSKDVHKQLALGPQRCSTESAVVVMRDWKSLNKGTGNPKQETT